MLRGIPAYIEATNDKGQNLLEQTLSQISSWQLQATFCQNLVSLNSWELKGSIEYFYCCEGHTFPISHADWPKKWQASHLPPHCVEPSYKQSLCVSFSDREWESVWTFLSRSCIGLLTWCMSSVKRGFVSFRQLVAFNAHLHNSICVCDFPFGKLWAFNLTSRAPLDTQRERERE